MTHLVTILLILLLLAIDVHAQAPEIKIDGQVRIRGEERQNKDFNDDFQDHDDFVLLRIRLGILAQFPEKDIDIYFKFQDSRSFGEEVNPIFSLRNVDLYEGYFLVKNIGGKPFGLKAGRQELIYGDQRLVGAFGWDNFGRTFDAIKVFYKSNYWQLDAWGAKVREGSPLVRSNPNAVSNSGKQFGDVDQDFFGIYSTWKTRLISTIEVYMLTLRDGVKTRGELSTDEPNRTFFHTFGSRIKGDIGTSFDFAFEVAGQAGNLGSNDLTAFALALKGGYKFNISSVKPRVGFIYAYASGDDDPTDGDSGTFQNLFPTNHGHYGFMDYQSWRNTNQLQLAFDLTTKSRFGLKVDYFIFRLAKERDAWYAASGAILRRDPTGLAGKEIGNEIDIVLSYPFRDLLHLNFGYGHFFAGDFVQNTGAGIADDSDFVYIQARVGF